VSEDVELTESQPALPNLPDRADAPVSEVTERFLRAVIAEIPVEQIEELHLFSPLRQGTLETGIAVIALRAAEPESQADGDEGGEMAPELPFETVVGEEPIDGDDAVGDEPMAANDAVGDEPIDVASEQDVHLSDATGTPAYFFQRSATDCITLV